MCIHHGPGRAKKGVQLAKYDFVVTTYDVVRSEQKASETGRAEGGALFQLRWFRVVLDEASRAALPLPLNGASSLMGPPCAQAHMIKNRDSQGSKACCSLRSVHRWCLTGTPIQNSVNDLFPLLRFLKCPKYESFAEFQALTSRGGGGSDRLSAILQSLMLRRLKSDHFNGRPILQLPQLRLRVVGEAMSASEQQVGTPRTHADALSRTRGAMDVTALVVRPAPRIRCTRRLRARRVSSSTPTCAVAPSRSVAKPL